MIGNFIKSVKTSTSVALAICLVSSIGLIIGSFFVPPLGVIDGSVLKATGEIIGIIGLLILREAIHEGIDAKFTHNGTTVELINDKKD